MACVTVQSINTQYISMPDCIFSTKAKRSEIKFKNFVIWWQKEALRYYWSNVISTEITTGIDKTFFYSYIWPNGIDYVDTGFFQLVILLWSDLTNWNWLLNVKIPRVGHRNCAAKKDIAHVWSLEHAWYVETAGWSFATFVLTSWIKNFQ